MIGLSPIDLLLADPLARPSNLALHFPGRLDPVRVGEALSRVSDVYSPIRSRLVEVDPTALALGEPGPAPRLHTVEVDDASLAPDRDLDLIDRLEPVTTSGPLTWFGLLRGSSRSALLISFSHVLGDAAALFDFLMDWVAIARGRPVEPPALDRGVFRAIFQDVKVDPRRIDFRSLAGRNRTFLAEGKRPMVDRADFIGVERQIVSREQVRDTIDAGIGATGRRLGAFSVLAAEVFRTKAEDNARTGSADTSIVVPIDLRRILPGVPKKYFGNALVTVSVTRSTAEVLAAPAVDRAGWIDDAVRAVDFDRLSLDWHLLDFLRKMRGFRKLQALRLTQPNSVLVSDVTYAPTGFVQFDGVRCDRVSFLSLYAHTVALMEHPAGWQAVRARMRAPVTA